MSDVVENHIIFHFPLLAISKNVSGVEAELEEFSANFVSDEILPPEIAVKEAEDRLKTRLGVLVGQVIISYLF